MSIKEKSKQINSMLIKKTRNFLFLKENIKKTVMAYSRYCRFLYLIILSTVMSLTEIILESKII